MKLLIVDDQYSVLQGLKTGIDWHDSEICEVFYAMSVLEAKMVLEQNKIDILLCDIEMPGEDGLDLIRWMNVQKMTTKCILLTAHSNFEYAKTGLQLGVVDYIVQPAAYGDIKKTVLKAAAVMNEEKKRLQLDHYGKILSINKQQMARDALLNIIRGNSSEKEMSSLIELGIFPENSANVCLGLYQILAWSHIGLWENRLITDTLDNIGKEIFDTFDQKWIITSVDKNNYIFMVWDEKEKLQRDYMEHQLKFFMNVSERFLECQAAIYFDALISIGELRKNGDRLFKMREDNITFKRGVFAIYQARKENHYQYKNRDIRYWGDMIKNGHGEAVRDNALTYLKELEEREILNADTLKYFYLDFMQAVYYASQALNIHIYDLFKSEEKVRLYLDGVSNVAQMKELVVYVIDGFEKMMHVEDEQNNIAKVVQEYIHAHLSMDIRRDDLAEYVHVNPDYLTRLFKKETGMSIKEYVINERMREAKALLEQTTLPVGVVAAMVGYYNFSYFSQTYKKVIGVSPSQEREGGDDEHGTD